MARVCHPQLGSVPAAYPPSSLAAVIGLSNNDVMSLRCVRYVGWKPRLTLVSASTRVLLNSEDCGPKIPKITLKLPS